MTRKPLAIVGIAVWVGLAIGGCVQAPAEVQFSPEFRAKHKAVTDKFSVYRADLQNEKPAAGGFGKAPAAA